MSEYRIMHVVESLSGGVAHSIMTIVNEYCDDIPAFIVHGDREFIEGQFKFSEKVELLKWGAVREVSPISDIIALLQLLEHIKRVRPTVIHAHSSKAGVIARLAAWLTSTPCLYTPHSYSFLRQDISRASRCAYWAIEWMMAHFSMTIACGLEEFKYASTLSDRCTVVENGVNIDIFEERLLPVSANSKTVIISVGRIAPQKNFPMFLEIAKHPSMSDTSFIWITGEDLIPEVDLPNVTILGRMKAIDVANHLKSATVFLNTSSWEGLSRAVIEAAATGLPLLLTNAPGNRELKFRSKEVFLFDTTEQAVNHIIHISDSVKAGKNVGSHNRVVARKFYDARYAQSRLRSMYDAIAFSRDTIT